jgi:hypothetical protein
MNRKIKLVSVFIVLTILVIGLILAYQFNIFSENTSYKYYQIKIISNNTNSYSIFLPIANIDSTKQSEIMDLINNDSIEQIKTEYGEAIKIQSSGNFTLKQELHKFESGRLDLSMREIKEINYKPRLFVWIYYNGTESLALSIELYSEIEEDNIFTSDKEWIENIVINENGWTQIQMNSEAGGD